MNQLPLLSSKLPLQSFPRRTMKLTGPTSMSTMVEKERKAREKERVNPRDRHPHGGSLLKATARAKVEKVEKEKEKAHVGLAAKDAATMLKMMPGILLGLGTSCLKSLPMILRPS